jgi:hypothetical protein
VARAPRGGSWKAEYAARIARYQREHPGASRSAARGHAGGAEKEADRFLRRLRRGLAPASSIHFAGTDRQPDGTWRRARFDLLGGDGEEDTFEIPEEALARLPEIRDAIAATGVAVLGADYLESMVEWVETELAPPPPMYAIESPRSGRFVSGVSKKGNALTRKTPGDALTSLDRRRLSRFLTKHPQLRKRGYRIVEVLL